MFNINKIQKAYKHTVQVVNRYHNSKLKSRRVGILNAYINHTPTVETVGYAIPLQTLAMQNKKACRITFNRLLLLFLTTVY